MDASNPADNIVWTDQRTAARSGIDEIDAQRAAVGSLAWMRGAQSGIRSQSQISYEAFDALTQPAAPPAGAIAEELAALELLGTDGSFTDRGAFVHALAEAVATRGVRITVASGERESSLFAGLDGEFALVVASQPLGESAEQPDVDGSGMDDDPANDDEAGVDAADPDSLEMPESLDTPETLGFSLIPVEGLPVALAQWLSVTPEWSFGNSDQYPISREQLDDLVYGLAPTLPGEAGEQLAAMATARWSRIELQFADAPVVEMFEVEGWGYFTPRPVEDPETGEISELVTLHCYPSAMMVDLLVFGVLAQLIA